MPAPDTISSEPTDFSRLLEQKARSVNGTLARLLSDQKQIDPALQEAIQYTLQAPGKRVRAALALFCCELISGSVNQNADIAAAAIEMVHTYSLVHDDLPAMDDDDLRRGLPTCHKAFNEATAILTGDALLTLAFEVLATQIDDPALAIKLIARLAQAAGPAGMIAGQMADLKAENDQGSKDLVEYIHINKTAKMFSCAAAMGALCGRADEKQIDCLSQYGLKIGLGFQVADDILDLSASTEQLGKTAGKDVKVAKCTYPAVMGLEKSKKTAEKLAKDATESLAPFGKKGDNLRNLVLAMLKRTR